MYKIVGRVELLDLLRSLDPSLRKLRISNIEISKKEYSILFNFICDQNVTAEVNEKILQEIEKIIPPAFTKYEVKVKKIVSDGALINNEIFKYLNANYRSISLFLEITDISSEVVDDLVKYTLRLTQDGVDYVNKNNALIKLNEFLATRFCSDFVGQMTVKPDDESVSLLDERVYEIQLQKIEHRTIKVSEVCVIDDIAMGDLATYIEDATSGSLTVCGKITDIMEKETKTGKPFFIITIDDTTGRLKGVYFTRKNTLSKIKDLKVDDEIIARGTLGEYNGNPSFTFEKINRCVFPKDFVKISKNKRKAPSEYKLIFPTPATTIKIKNVFEKEVALPKELTSSEYVVFDLETTGLSANNDGITEIGAVKIKNGKVYEEFTSLIKPEYPITQEITNITGIDEEMVKDAPSIEQVLPDFLKFIDGAVLVGHNVSFDMGFIKRFANEQDFEVGNKVLDTMELSRKYVQGLKRNDLHTLADHFGIVFRHHRALSDALATAECFIEIMKIKGQNA